MITYEEFHDSELRREFNEAIELIRSQTNRSLDALSNGMSDRIKKERARVERQTVTYADPRRSGPLTGFPERIIVGRGVKRFGKSREFHYALISPPNSNKWSMTGQRGLTSVPWSAILAELRRDEPNPQDVFDTLSFQAVTA